MLRQLYQQDISEYFNYEDSYGTPSYWLFCVIGPSRDALETLVDCLRGAYSPAEAGYPSIDAVLQHTSVAFPLAGIDPASSNLSGVLALDRFSIGQPPQKFSQAIAYLNGLTSVQNALNSAGVSGADLQRLRSDWIECAKRLSHPPVNEAAIVAAADSLSFSVGLRAIGKYVKSGCKGLSCPAVPKIGKS